MDIPTGNTKKIMADSQLEITNPDFNTLVLNRIMKKQRSRLIISHVFLYIVILAITSGIIITRANGIVPLADIISNDIVQLGTWFLNYEFILLPFFILLLVKGIIDIALHRRINN